MVAHAYCQMKIGVVMVDVVQVTVMINYPILIYCVVDDQYNLASLEAPGKITLKKKINKIKVNLISQSGWI